MMRIYPIGQHQAPSLQCSAFGQGVPAISQPLYGIIVIYYRVEFDSLPKLRNIGDQKMQFAVCTLLYFRVTDLIYFNRWKAEDIVVTRAFLRHQALWFLCRNSRRSPITLIHKQLTLAQVWNGMLCTKVWHSTVSLFLEGEFLVWGVAGFILGGGTVYQCPLIYGLTISKISSSSH